MTEHSLIADGKDSKIQRENKYLSEIKEIIPYALGYIFDILVKVLQRFDEVDVEIKPKHRLADFVVWGETISRVLGHDKNEFLKAWEQNTKTQNRAVIQNNSFAILLIKYVFNKRQEKEFGIEPEELLRELKEFAPEIGIEYYKDRQLPENAVWITRKLNMIKTDLKAAGIRIVEKKSDERIIWIEKVDQDETHFVLQENLNNI